MDQHSELEKSFLETYEQLADPIYRHCYFRVSSAELAEDLTQEAFAKMWNYLAEGNIIDNPKAFLYRVAGNLIIDHYRRKKEASLDALAESGYDPEGDDETGILDASAGNQAIASLEKLDAEYREVLTMRYISDLSIAEIAEAVGQSENAVSVRIHRGIRKLKTILHYEKPD